MGRVCGEILNTKLTPLKPPKKKQLVNPMKEFQLVRDLRSSETKEET